MNFGLGPAGTPGRGLAAAIAAISFLGCTQSASQPSAPVAVATLRVSYTDATGPHTLLLDSQPISCTPGTNKLKDFQHVLSDPEADGVFSMFINDTKVQTVSISLGQDLFFTSTKAGEMTDGSFAELRGTVARNAAGTVTPVDDQATTSGQVSCG